jgi:hypothetical protein
MILRKSSIYFLLIYLLIVINQPSVLAIDVTDIPVNPGVMGRENLDSFKENNYQNEDIDNKKPRDKIKVDANLNS